MKAYNESVRPPQTVSRTRDFLFVARPAVYILVVLGVLATSFLYKLRVDNIFACQASGYTSDRYLERCDATDYADYEHGAFWFDLEPEAEKSAVSADVLFLDGSQMQFAFSTAATAKWFSTTPSRYYLLGFFAFENSIFEGALLRKLKPRAKVYVIAISDFFEPSEAPVAKAMMHDAAQRSKYKIKRYLQFVHKAICMKLTKICGNSMVVFRSRQTGMSYMPLTNKFKGRERPVSYDQQIDERKIDSAIAIGRSFLSELPVKTECVILTAIPTVSTKLSVASAIAKGLGKMLVVPQQFDDLQTFDGLHLEHASAERWSEAFFKIAGPQIQECLEATHNGGNLQRSAE